MTNNLKQIFDFLGNYIPNQTNFLWEKYEILKREYLDKEIDYPVLWDINITN